MSILKRRLNESNLKLLSDYGLDHLMTYILKSDIILFEDKMSEKVYNIVKSGKTKNEIKEDLKKIGFYDF
jgi:hypothetical protein